MAHIKSPRGESKRAHKPSADAYVLVSVNNVFQFHSEVERQLLLRTDWRKGDQNTDANSWNLLFSDRGLNVSWDTIKQGKRAAPPVVNYLRSFRNLTDKTRLLRTYRAYANHTNQDPYEFFPQSFIVPPKSQDKGNNSGRNSRNASPNISARNSPNNSGRNSAHNSGRNSRNASGQNSPSGKPRWNSSSKPTNGSGQNSPSGKRGTNKPLNGSGQNSPSGKVVVAGAPTGGGAEGENKSPRATSAGAGGGSKVKPGLARSASLTVPGQAPVAVPTERERRERATVTEDERIQFLFCHEMFKKNRGTVWIAKPAIGAQGQNVLVSDDPEKLLAHVDAQLLPAKQLGNKSPRDKGKPKVASTSLPWVLQKYIEAPFLINNKKFDMRVWVLVTNDFKIYANCNAVCRVSSAPFRMDNLNDPFVHVTSLSLQRNHPDYSTEFLGNEVFVDAFQRYLDKLGTRISFEKIIWPQMARIIVQTVLSNRDMMRCPGDYRGFQFFGYDFIMDKKLRVSLLEINGTPAVSELLLEHMVADAIELSVDVMCPPKAAYIKKGDTVDRKRQNGFRLLYDGVTNETFYKELVRPPPTPPMSPAT